MIYRMLAFAILTVFAFTASAAAELDQLLEKGRDAWQLLG